MNLDLRKEILKASLEIEAKLSEILMQLLDIKQTDNKSLGYKGSALSLKSKVDLLYDINKIEKKSYDKLIMFMEIRNQFIHNLDANTFEVVLSRINKKNKLIKFSKEYRTSKNLITSNKLTEEETYIASFELLAMAIHEDLHNTTQKVLKEKLELVENKIKAYQNELNDKALKAIGDAIDQSIELFEKRWKEVFGEEYDMAGLLKQSIHGFYTKNLNENLDN